MFRVSTASDCQHRPSGLGARARHANAEQKSGAKLSESGHLASSLWTAVSPTTRGVVFLPAKVRRTNQSPTLGRSHGLGGRICPLGSGANAGRLANPVLAFNPVLRRP